MKRDSFTFYRSFMEGTDSLDDKTYRRLMTAITHFALNGEEPELTGLENTVFQSWKANVVASNKRKDNGSHGGRPPKNQNEEEKTNGYDLETNGFEEKTNGYDGENQWFQGEKPMVTGMETNGFAGENLTRVQKEKEKKKEKENNNPPLPPWGGTEGQTSPDHPKTPAAADNVAWFDLHCTETAMSGLMKKHARRWLLSIGEKYRRLTESDVLQFLEVLCQKVAEFGEKAVIDQISRDMSAGYKNISWDKLEERMEKNPSLRPPPEDCPETVHEEPEHVMTDEEWEAWEPPEVDFSSPPPGMPKEEWDALALTSAKATKHEGIDSG